MPDESGTPKTDIRSTPGAMPNTLLTPVSDNDLTQPNSEKKTYDEEYVKSLRQENAAARTKLKAVEAAHAAKISETENERLAGLPEIERLKAEIEIERKKSRTLEVTRHRERACTAYALPDDLSEFITGEDENTCKRQAATLSEKLKTASQLPDSGGRSPAHDKNTETQRQERLARLKKNVPALANRTLR